MHSSRSKKKIASKNKEDGSNDIIQVLETGKEKDDASEFIRKLYMIYCRVVKLVALNPQKLQGKLKKIISVANVGKCLQQTKSRKHTWKVYTQLISVKRVL